MPKTREAIRIVEQDGWYYVRTRGNHPIYHLPVKPGIVVIPGHPGDDVDKGTWLNILRQAGLREGRR
ncbi:MAG: type II toxin-antitoxin system HicA family toxin [Chloroflexi bacterium]|nr:type II toxin-antitoxin system HicA family toxin [Chloroflexota bacterium]